MDYIKNMKNIIRGYCKNEKAKYVICSFIMFVLQLLIIFILVEWCFFDKICANNISCVASFVMCFLVYRNIVFKSKTNKYKQFLNYIAVYVVNSIIFAVLYDFMLSRINIHYLCMRIILDIVIFTINYVLNKFVIYR